MSWLSFEHPAFAALLADRERALAFYTSNGVERYLKRYAQGESQTAFNERVALAHPDGHLALVVDTIGGMVLRGGDRAPVRDWGSLGDPDTPGTAAYKLVRDADGTGTGWDALMQQAAIELLLTGECWAVADPVLDATTGRVRPRVRLLPTLTVQNWDDRAGAVAEALTRTRADVRRSIRDAPVLEDQWILYTPTGWEKYREQDDKAVLLDSSTYSESGRPYVDRDGRPTAPVLRVQLPFRRYFAGQLAKQAQGLYSRRSDRDALQRSACHPRLVLSADDDAFDAIVAGLKKGSNILKHDPQDSGSHSYISPSMEGVKTASDVLEADERAFFQSAFRILSAEGQVARTATEAALDRSSGLAAALALIATSMQELERSLTHLCEQALSDRPADWTSDSTWDLDYSSVTLSETETL